MTNSRKVQGMNTFSFSSFWQIQAAESPLMWSEVIGSSGKVRFWTPPKFVLHQSQTSAWQAARSLIVFAALFTNRGLEENWRGRICKVIEAGRALKAGGGRRCGYSLILKHRCRLPPAFKHSPPPSCLVAKCLSIWSSIKSWLLWICLFPNLWFAQMSMI